MKHQLVLVTGSCPGAGKTEFTRCLADEFEHRSIKHDLLLELDERWNQIGSLSMRALVEDTPDRITGLLQAASYVVDQFVQPEQMLIVDAMALMPAFIYLVGHQTEREIEAYVEKLWQIVEPTLPLLMYLKCDAEIGLRRAINRSGDAWIEGFLKRLQDGRFVLRPADESATPETAIQYFKKVDEVGKAALVKHWKGRVFEADTSESPAEASEWLVQLVRSVIC